MARKYIDCREYPEAKCSVSIFADTESELLEAAMQHAITVHGFQDTPQAREQMRQSFREEKRHAA